MDPQGSNGGQPTNQPAPGNDNPSNEEVIVDIELTDDDTALLDDDMSNKVKSISAQKAHFRTKYEKTAKDFEDYKKAHPETPAAPQKKSEEDGKKPTKADEIAELRADNLRINLRLANPGVKLTDKQLDLAINHSKITGTSAQEVLDSDFFKSYLKTETDKEAAAGAVPNPTNRSGSSAPNFENLSADQIAALSPQDYEKYQKFQRAKGGNGSGIRVRPATNM